MSFHHRQLLIRARCEAHRVAQSVPKCLSQMGVTGHAEDATNILPFQALIYHGWKYGQLKRAPLWAGDLEQRIHQSFGVVLLLLKFPSLGLKSWVSTGLSQLLVADHSFIASALPAKCYRHMQKRGDFCHLTAHPEVEGALQVPLHNVFSFTKKNNWPNSVHPTMSHFSTYCVTCINFVHIYTYIYIRNIYVCIYVCIISIH